MKKYIIVLILSLCAQEKEFVYKLNEYNKMSCAKILQLNYQQVSKYIAYSLLPALGFYVLSLLVKDKNRIYLLKNFAKLSPIVVFGGLLKQGYQQGKLIFFETFEYNYEIFGWQVPHGINMRVMTKGQRGEGKNFSYCDYLLYENEKTIEIVNKKLEYTEIIKKFIILSDETKKKIFNEFLAREYRIAFSPSIENIAVQEKNCIDEKGLQSRLFYVVKDEQVMGKNEGGVRCLCNEGTLTILFLYNDNDIEEDQMLKLLYRIFSYYENQNYRIINIEKQNYINDDKMFTIEEQLDCVLGVSKTKQKERYQETRFEKKIIYSDLKRTIHPIIQENNLQLMRSEDFSRIVLTVHSQIINDRTGGINQERRDILNVGRSAWLDKKHGTDVHYIVSVKADKIPKSAQNAIYRFLVQAYKEYWAEKRKNRRYVALINEAVIGQGKYGARFYYRHKFGFQQCLFRDDDTLPFAMEYIDLEKYMILDENEIDYKQSLP